MPKEILNFILLQNYLLGKKETSEMADRNKEVLLEVRISNQKVTLEFEDKLLKVVVIEIDGQSRM